MVKYLPINCQTSRVNSQPALALASPVRSCKLTGLRLPEDFHLKFGLQPHPETGAPWYLPRLASDQKHKSEPTDLSEQESSDVGESTSQPDTTVSESSNPSLKRTLSSAHFTARYDALRFISNLRRRHLRALIPFVWKEDPSLDLDDLVWREDMAEYVLALLRNNVVHRLTSLGARPVGYISPCLGWDHIDKHHQVAAVLWLGGPLPMNKHIRAGGGSTDEEEDKEKRDMGPPAYAMVYYRNRYIPAYNLPDLLGRRLLSRLETGCEHFKGSMAVLKQKHLTTEAQLGLWRLMGYLAPYTEE